MTSSWYIIVLVGLAAAGILLMVYRKNQAVTRAVRLETAPDGHRDYATEREVARVAHMSADDRAWEAASLQRNQARTDRAVASAGQRVEVRPQ